jgi:hypothetical protein
VTHPILSLARLGLAAETPEPYRAAAPIQHIREQRQTGACMARVPIGHFTLIEAVEAYRKAWLKDNAYEPLSSEETTKMENFRAQLLSAMLTKAPPPPTSILATRRSISDASEAIDQNPGVEWVKQENRALSMRARMYPIQYKYAEDTVLGALSEGLVSSKLLAHASGHQFPLPKNFWLSDYCEPARKGEQVKWLFGDHWFDGTPIVASTSITGLATTISTLAATLPNKQEAPSTQEMPRASDPPMILTNVSSFVDVFGGEAKAGLESDGLDNPSAPAVAESIKALALAKGVPATHIPSAYSLESELRKKICPPTAPERRRNARVPKAKSGKKPD